MSELTEFLLARIAEDLSEIPPLGDDPSLPYGQHWSEVPFPTASAARGRAMLLALRAVVVRAADVKWVGSYAVRDVLLGEIATIYADHPDYREEWKA